MKPEDSFLKRLQPLDNLPRLLNKSERFGTFNDTTLGFLLVRPSFLSLTYSLMVEGRM